MFVPQQIYRWLASFQLLPKEAQINDRHLVPIPSQNIPSFENGFTIAQIITNILNNNHKTAPSSLNNIRKDNNKNTKLTNWNFIWLSFDDIHLQVDTRIKDLILQGQDTLIIEIVKQLYEKDQNKNTQKMKTVVLKQKTSIRKIQKNIRNAGKGSSLDIKKINTQKNPDDSDSSLQYLILLLSSSLGLNIQEILGLFTNQNKYLAHIIVKGVNDDFGGILVFFTLLNKHSNKLKYFCANDQNDAYSCLYAIKPGFISKEPKVAQLTLSLFQKLQNIYPWFISQQSKGAHTFLLGIKRHPELSHHYFNLLLQIINNQELEFFASCFKQSFRNPQEMIEVCNALVQNLGQSYLRTKLIDAGIISEWLDVASHIFDNDSLDSKLLSYQFLGNCLLWLPEGVRQNQQSLITFSKEWEKHPIFEFTTLFNEVVHILQKLAANKNIYASKIYQIIIEIYVQISSEPQKQSYIIHNFSILVPHYPKIPTEFFIETFKSEYLNSSNFNLIETSIQINQDPQALYKIGEFLLQLFIHDSVVNHYLGPLILQITKKIIEYSTGHKFIKKVIKQLLLTFSQIETQKKIPQLAKPQPMYFNFKGNSEKLTQEQVLIYKIKEKETVNFLQFIDKLSSLFKNISNECLQKQLKQQLLQTNAYVRKNTHKKGNKKLSQILRKLGISKEDVEDYDDEYRNKVQIQEMQNSIARKKQIAKNASLIGESSRISGPQNLKKQFTEMIKKRRKEEEQKREQIEKRKKQVNLKETVVKKQIELAKLMRGYGNGQVELKQQGFWNRIIKEEKELQIYPPQLMEERDVQYIENTLRKYHKPIRLIFMKYSSSMYSVKSTLSFEDNQIRKESINVVQLIKFLKDYKLFSITNNTQIQQLVRDINVKMINRRQTQELDFTGFQTFLAQFSATIFTKSHAHHKKQNKLQHLPHFQLIQELINHLKNVFKEKGENVSIFEQPQTAYFNETEVVKQFNRKLQKDSNFILPQGYKKVTDKIIHFEPKYSSKATKNIKSSYLDVYQILDQMLSSSPLNLHIMEPICSKVTKVRAKPHIFANVKPKLMSDTLEGKRALSTVFDKKASIPPIKMLQRKVFSFGMKLGLSYISYKDKLIGEQVAYVIDDMLTAVQNGKSTLQKQKVLNEVVKRRKQVQFFERRAESQREKKRKDRMVELERLKKQITQKKEKEEDEAREERERMRQRQLSKQRKMKEERKRYLSEQKKKLQQKWEKEKFVKKEEELKEKQKQGQRKSKSKFKEFNHNQIQKFRKSYEKNIEEKKKIIEKAEEEKRQKDQIYLKLRNKIRQDDRRIIEIRQKNNEQINELFNSSEISAIFRQFEPNLKGIFDFLIKNTYLSITQRKHNNEIILEKWHYFNYTFQLNPLIIVAKEVQSIFINLTKDKQIRKQYHLGLNYQEFLQGLLRITIKHKSVFNKLSMKIKDENMSQKEINAIVEKDIRQKQKNEFEEKDIDVKGLLQQEDINKQIIDDYGDISKVNGQTLKGLIYYLKVPKQKKRQQERFRQVLSQKLQNKHHNYEKLKQKLKQEYTLSPKKKKPKSVPKIEEKEDKTKKEVKKGKSKNK